MLKRNLINAIDEVKAPERRLNILMPVMAVFALAGVIYFLFNVLSNKSDKELEDCRQDKKELKADLFIMTHENDSLKAKIIFDALEINRKLRDIILNQERQKNLLKKKK